MPGQTGITWRGGHRLAPKMHTARLATLARVDRLSSRTLIKVTKSGRNTSRRTEEGAVRVAMRPTRLWLMATAVLAMASAASMSHAAPADAFGQHDDFTPQQNQI